MKLQLHHASLQLGKKLFGPFDFTIWPGERIAILGKSGAGKSTIIRLIAREYQIKSGSILMNGTSIEQYSSAQLSRIRGVLPQNTQIAFGLMTDLVIEIGRVSATNKINQETIVVLAAKMACADHLLGRAFNTLSGGEQARIHLARVFAQLWDIRDGLILVDEPVAALDPGLQYQLLDTIDRFARERNHAVLAVLHDINHALVFERLLLIEHGRIIQDCPADHHARADLERLYGIQLEHLQDSQGASVLVQVR
ncbi:ATP-binding cassette domain-containing protein [Polynucleobacter sp. HIN7]|uniref:ATP-binding cassette domain-containing protein n=1 Tax=Polynucleobacter sp. HIN7 TaxID=3047866 RepID=UPI0025748C9F|nr:ATP-binding cassette domain-containing protein [Polynucleobacter sp. HIN7]BEI37007.1 heme ABC transporter ATP-binding protein [Polynucleobacter sp. HIN7]